MRVLPRHKPIKNLSLQGRVSPNKSALEGRPIFKKVIKKIGCWIARYLGTCGGYVCVCVGTVHGYGAQYHSYVHVCRTSVPMSHTMCTLFILPVVLSKLCLKKVAIRALSFKIDKVYWSFYLHRPHMGSCRILY